MAEAPGASSDHRDQGGLPDDRVLALRGRVIGVFITSQVIGTSDGHNDYFRADRTWLYVVLLTIAYLLSRGLAKSGSREPYPDR
jgi:hypothetical protein